MERQELHCHACGNYVRFMLDTNINGNYVLNCPECDHEHCRVVNNGRITDIRWDQRNGSPLNGLPVYNIASSGTSTSAVSYDQQWRSSGSNVPFDNWLYVGTSSAGTGSTSITYTATTA